MATYTVQSGDTLSALAQKYGTSVDEIAKTNNITNPNLIKVGQTLNIGATTPTNVSTYDTEQYRIALANLTKPKTPTTTSYSFNNTQYNVPPNTPAITTPTITPPATQTPPQSPSGGSYTVVSGDTLSQIARRNGTTVQQLQALNPSITDPNLIRVGQSINLGGSQVGQTPTDKQSTVTTNQTLTPEQQRAQQNADLAKRAGEAGLSVTEYQALMSSQNGVSQEESDKIKKELGIETLEGAVFAKPTETTEKMFDTAYKTAGLEELKTKINTINQEIDKIRADLTEATGMIDENPFLTEKSRVGRGQRLLSQAESQINNKIAQAKTLQDLYDGSIKEITAMIERNKADFGTNQALDQAKLNYLVAKAEKQVETLSKTRSSDATSTGAYLKARTNSKAPDLIGTSDTGYYKWDPSTQKFVQVIAPVASKTVSESSTLFKPSSTEKSLVGRFLNTAEGKALYNGQTLTTADINAINSDPTLFYALLQKANENGIY
jgi:LysM repeat protein